MQGYNHVVGGVVFTGIFASFHDVNVLSTPGLIGATVGCALLPDVDHVSSTIGKVFYPVAKLLQSRYGHRTITHSIFCFATVLTLFLFTLPRAYVVCCSYAFSSHLLFDMCTRSGVPLLYPFSRRPFVLPANPGMRLSSTDQRGELVVLAVFILMGSFCRPLMAQGFWTSYNQAFATWEHVEREGKRSRDLLKVFYTDNQKHQRWGYFYRAEGSTLIVLTAAGFELPKATETTLISFQHSGITATERQHTLTSVPLDSLNHLLSNYCLRVQVQSLDDLTYFDGPLMQVGKMIDLPYRKSLLISQLPPDDSAIINRLQLLTSERETERRQHQRALQTYSAEVYRMTQLEKLLHQLAVEYGNATDYRKGEIIKQRQEVERTLANAQTSRPIPPVVPDYRRFEIEEQLLKKQLKHASQISAHITTVSTSKPLR